MISVRALQLFKALRRLTVSCILSVTVPLAAEPVIIPSAITSGGSLLTQGSTVIEANWAPVIANGDIGSLSLDFNYWPSPPPGTLGLNAGHKFTGAGIPASNSPYYGIEKWLRWQCTGSLLEYGGGAYPVFQPSSIGGVPITDFYTQVMNGAFAGLSCSNVSLQGRYSLLPTALCTAEGVLFDAAVAGVHPMGEGALVQNWPGVATKVNDTLSSFSYAMWKQTAIDHGYYLRPGSVWGAPFLDQNGNPLYVRPTAGQWQITTEPAGNTPLTSLEQITMKSLVPQDRNTTLLPDRILFVDTLEGTENGTAPHIEIGSSDDFFWKGVIYVNGNLEVNAASGPAIIMKDPEQYAADPTGTATGQVIPNCFLDGILYLTGRADRTGNANLYGALVYKNGSIGPAGPTVFYHSRLRTEGILAPHTGPFISTQSGDWFDRATWGGIGVPDRGSSVTISLGHTVGMYGSVVGMQSFTNYGHLFAEGELGVTEGAFEDFGGILNFGPYGYRLSMEGACTARFHGEFPLDFESVEFRSDDQPVTSTISGYANMDKLTLINTHLEQQDDYVYPYELYLVKDSSVGQNTLIPGGPHTIYYWNGTFTAGPEWQPLDMGGGAYPDTVYLGESSVTLPSTGGGVYRTTQINMHDASLHTPTNGLEVSNAIYNYGHLHVNGPIRTWDNMADANVVTDLGGAVTTTRTLALGLVKFPYCDAEMEFSGLGGATVAAVTKRVDAAPNAPIGISSTGTYYELEANGAGFSTTLRLPHANFADPYLCRYTGNGTSWVPARTQFNSSTVELSGVGEFSTWAVGDAVLGPLPVAVSGFSAD